MFYIYAGVYDQWGTATPHAFGRDPAAVISIYLLFVFHISFEVIILSRVLLGSCLFGFTLSTMLIKRERILFLNTKLAQLNEKFSIFMLLNFCI